MFRMLTILILLIGCKAKQSDSSVAIAAPNKTALASSIPAQVIPEVSVPKVPEISSAVNEIKSEAATYLATVKDEPATTQDEQDFRSALEQIQKADPKAVQEFIEQQGFSKTETKADKLHAALVSQGSDPATTSNLLKGVLISAVIISAISVIGGAAVLTKNFSTVNVMDTHLSTRRFGSTVMGLALNGMTLTVAAALLSEGDDAGSDNKALIGLAVLLGIKATSLVASSMQNMMSPDDVKMEAIKNQLRQNGAGIIDTDRIVAKATLSKPTDEELEQIKSKITSKQDVTLLEMAQYELHDPKFDAKFTKVNFGANIALLGVGAGVATLAALTTKGLNLSDAAETPKARIIRKIQEFWLKMKALEIHRKA